MNYSTDMLESAQCQLMHIDIELLGLPSKLSTMQTADENGNPQKIFANDDDCAADGLQDPWIEKGSFMPCYREFLELKKRLSFNVLGYGLFAPTHLGYLALKEVEDFNERLGVLRKRVAGLLLKRYPTELKRQYISRFNPRVKCALHLMPKYLVEDSDFIRQLRRTFKNELRQGHNLVEWLLRPTGIRPLSKRSIVMKDAKSELCALYLESEVVKLF